MNKEKLVYKIFRKDINGKKLLCTQSIEDKRLFNIICKSHQYEIWVNDKNITNNYIGDYI